VIDMKKFIGDGVTAKGFYRLNLVEHGKDGKVKISGDSGWIPNQITNYGYQYAIIGPMVADAASVVVTAAALGTGTAPASNTNSLPGEVASAGMRFSLVKTLTGTKSAQWTGSLNSNVIASTVSISNVGLFNTLNITAGSIVAGNTYASSTVATNQSINLTYSITFS